MQTQEVQHNQELIPITPIKMRVSGNTVTVSVTIDEDATDAQILNNVDEVGKQLSRNTRIGMDLYLMMGKLLGAVEKREIYLDQRWGSMEKFVDWINQRHGIPPSTLYNWTSITEHIPGLSIKQAERVGHSNLLQIARAIKLQKKDGSSESKINRITERLLTDAEKAPTEQFREKLEREKLLKPKKGTRRGYGKLTAEIKIRVLEALWMYAEERSISDALEELLEIAQTRKKPASKSVAA